MEDFENKDSKRALRRVHNKRMKLKAERFGVDKKFADHLASCSCHMCGNPRKHWQEVTIQEKKNNDWKD